MKLFPEKRRFVKSFCALSVMTLMVCSSLSAAAAIVNAAASETVSVPQSTTQAVKPGKQDRRPRPQCVGDAVHGGDRA